MHNHCRCEDRNAQDKSSAAIFSKSGASDQNTSVTRPLSQDRCQYEQSDAYLLSATISSSKTAISSSRRAPPQTPHVLAGSALYIALAEIWSQLWMATNSKVGRSGRSLATAKNCSKAHTSMHIQIACLRVCVTEISYKT